MRDGLYPVSGRRRETWDRRMKSFFSILCVLTAAMPALAQEPAGCDKFKWPIEKARATLTGTDLPRLVSGSKATWPLPFATTIALVPLADANLPVAPERAPKSNNTFGGFID